MTFSRDFLSIVVPICNEEANLPELCRRLKAAIEEMRFSKNEVLLISDGSVDRSESIIRSIVVEDPVFRGIFLTRNFGHQAAVSIGLAESQGTLIAVIDGDLQDPPEAIALLVGAIEEGADVAFGVRTRRKEGALRKASYYLFYRLLRLISDIDIPLDAGDFACMRRSVVDAMLTLPERNRFIRGLRTWVGYRHQGVTYERAARFAGQPKYTLGKLFGLAYDGMFAFSRLPIRIMQFLGFVASVGAMLVALAYVILYVIASSRFPSGFATLTISIWFLAGVQFLFLGIVGEYVVRTFDESRHRPVALIREIVIHPGNSRGTESTGEPPLPQSRNNGREFC